MDDRDLKPDNALLLDLSDERDPLVIRAMVRFCRLLAELDAAEERRRCHAAAVASGDAHHRS